MGYGYGQGRQSYPVYFPQFPPAASAPALPAASFAAPDSATPYRSSPYAPYAPMPPVAPVAAPSRGRRTLVWSLTAGVAATALVLTGMGLERLRTTKPQVAQSAADGAALVASRAKIVAELPRLESWIAQDRGLAWKRTVSPEVLSDKDFLAALSSGGDSGGPADLPGDPDDIGTTYAAMGLAASADDFYNADNSSTASGIVGFYDDRTKRLVVRGTSWSPSMEYTLVHELTHALQDQAFDLTALDKAVRTDDETILTVRAAIEGDAVRVADDYYAEQSAAWQRQVDADQGSGSSSTSDTAFADIYEGLPYAFGERFVSRVADAGGNAAVDRAFRSPPQTSAQLLHPKEWSAGQFPAAAAVSQPPVAKPRDVADRGVLGQVGLWAAAEADDPRPADALKLDGWAGDSYVSTDDGSQVCFVDEVRFSSAAARGAALAFLTRWTGPKKIAVTLEGDSNVRLSACQAS